MAITRYNPFTGPDEFPTGLRLFQDAVDRLFNEPPATRPWVPQVDIYETKDELVLKADVPDVEMKDIDIRLENGTLSVRGERKFEQKKDQDGGYHRIERAYGSFERYFTLPDSVDTDKVRADYKDGVLSITLPKKEVAKPKQIKVEISKN